jgi:hypothetical protein
MKSLFALLALIIAVSSCALAQGKQDPNMRQIRRDLSPKTSGSSVAVPRHYSSAPAPKSSVAASANAELTKLEQSTAKLSTAKPHRTSNAMVSLPKEPSESKTGSGLRAIPPRHKDQMTTNSSKGRSRVGAKRGRSY